jgi:hypothetical protein
MSVVSKCNPEFRDGFLDTYLFIRGPVLRMVRRWERPIRRSLTSNRGKAMEKQSFSVQVVGTPLLMTFFVLGLVNRAASCPALNDV